MTLLERAGGAEAVKAVLTDFYDRVFADVMIGFFFARADKARLVQKELELTLAFMGGGQKYTGTPLPEAHGKHSIQGGHFMRRLQILKETLAQHRIPEDVATAWIAHNESLRPAITRFAGSDCE